MSEITLRYMVPVDVTVNVADKVVTRVVTLDEEVRLDMVPPFTHSEAQGLVVAESQDWPAWEHGL